MSNKETCGSCARYLKPALHKGKHGRMFCSLGHETVLPATPACADWVGAWPKDPSSPAPRAYKVMVDDCKGCPFMHIWSNNWFCYHPLLDGKPLIVTSACDAGAVHENCLLVGRVIMVAGPQIEDVENSV